MWMKENVFDVLMYLFENYFYDPESDPDRASLESELSEAGFSKVEVRKAFEWLDGLAESRDLPAPGSAGRLAVRVFTEQECARLDAECRGFLLFLEQAGILAPISRELVVDRVMALEDDEIDLDTLKWVILMVLFSQPGQEEAYAWMENLIFDSPTQYLH
jgi:Smg protein